MFPSLEWQRWIHENFAAFEHLQSWWWNTSANSAANPATWPQTNGQTSLQSCRLPICQKSIRRKSLMSPPKAPWKWLSSWNQYVGIARSERINGLELNENSIEKMSNQLLLLPSPIETRHQQETAHCKSAESQRMDCKYLMFPKTNWKKSESQNS